MIRALILASAFVAIANAVPNAACSAHSTLGAVCDSGEICCGTATTIGTGNNAGVCKTGTNEANTCAAGTLPLCRQKVITGNGNSFDSKNTCPTTGTNACTAALTSADVYSVPCTKCSTSSLYTQPRWTVATTCTGGYCYCTYCPGSAEYGSTTDNFGVTSCALGSHDSSWDDLATGLGTAIIVVIIVCVLLFVVLPIGCCILICCCGVAICGMGAKAATDAPVAQGGQMHCAPPAGVPPPAVGTAEPVKA